MVVHRASRMMLGIPQSSSKTKSLSYHVMLEKGLIHPAGRGLFSVLPLACDRQACAANRGRAECDWCVQNVYAIAGCQGVVEESWTMGQNWCRNISCH
uniref:Proline--tRNA ligase n=1 Tax=Parascaris univalens TaxID=6257 RepID=A0A915C4M0_PARUN